VNPFYRSTLPIEEKVAYCTEFYAATGLPAIFRLLPFSEPASLDSWLDVQGWKSFDRTLVLRAELADVPAVVMPKLAVELIEPPQWEPLVAHLLSIPDEALPRYVDRAATYPLPHVGAIARCDEEIVACGLLKLEGDHAGLFAVQTAKRWRCRGLGRAIVAALLGEARRRGARHAYLQVTEDNGPALAVYAHFGFVAAYSYWYRAQLKRGET
jgi:GNAT superfamily N-acetyltransferase